MKLRCRDKGDRDREGVGVYLPFVPGLTEVSCWAQGLALWLWFPHVHASPTNSTLCVEHLLCARYCLKPFRKVLQRTGGGSHFCNWTCCWPRISLPSFLNTHTCSLLQAAFFGLSHLHPTGFPEPLSPASSHLPP